MSEENIAESFKGWILTNLESINEPVKLPEHGSCLVCGGQNSNGFKLAWFARKSEKPGGITIFAEFKFDLAQQGPPNFAHGGASAAVLDEAMGVPAWCAGLRVVLANMNVTYMAPVPLGKGIRVEAWLERKERNKAFTAGHIMLPDGSEAVKGTGLFVEAPHIFQNVRDPFK